MYSQKGFSPIIILVGILVLGGLLFGAFYLGKNSSSTTVMPTVQPTPLAISSPKPTSDVIYITKDDIPKPNMVYLGKYEDKDILFVTNQQLGKYYEGIDAKFSPMRGYFSYVPNLNKYPTAFNELEEPKGILALPNDILQINNFKFTEDKAFIYFSVMLVTKPANPYPDNVTNHIYKVNLANLQNQDVWVHDLNPNKYKNAGGATLVEKISLDNNYIVLSIYGCFACESLEVGQIIVNMQTKGEKYLEGIGDVQFNLADKTFSYKKLAPSKESCGAESGQGCDQDNNRTLYKPTGEVFTSPLP